MTILERCRFCGADVESIANHYGGYKCEPCREVRMALDPTWWPGLQDHYRLSDTEKAARRLERVKKWRDRGRRRRQLAQEGITL